MHDYEARAAMTADDILGRFGAAIDTLEGVRALLQLAWLEGTRAGADSAMQAVREVLDGHSVKA